jgi:predicted phage gp36 major capsid-like protein
MTATTPPQLTTPGGGGLTDLREAERAAAERVAAISAMRTAMVGYMDCMRLTMGDTASAADAEIAEALHELWALAMRMQTPEPGDVVVWQEVESVVLAAVCAVGSFRRVLAPVIDEIAATVQVIGPLLRMSEDEVDARATLVIAERTTALAEDAARYPVH